MGIEVNGGTHQHNFVRAVDKKKHVLCKKNGVTLYEVWNIDDFWSLRTKLWKIYGSKVAPEINRDLMWRIERYGARKINKYEAYYLVRDVNTKIREEKEKAVWAQRTKKPKRHQAHLLAKEKALARTGRKFQRREALVYAESE